MGFIVVDGAIALEVEMWNKRPKIRDLNWIHDATTPTPTSATFRDYNSRIYDDPIRGALSESRMLWERPRLNKP